MNYLTLKVDWDAASALLVTILKENLENFRSDWMRVYTEKRGFTFSDDYEEDLKQISEHISAIKKILEYYGETQV